MIYVWHFRRAIFHRRERVNDPRYTTLLSVREANARLKCRRRKGISAMVQGGRFRETIVVSIKPSLKASQLYPSSGNEVITRSVEQLQLICNTSMQRSQVDEVYQCH